MTGHPALRSAIRAKPRKKRHPTGRRPERAWIRRMAVVSAENSQAWAENGEELGVSQSPLGLEYQNFQETLDHNDPEHPKG